MVYLGKITKVRSNKGEVVYASPHGDIYTPNNGETLLLKSEKYSKELQVEYFKDIKGLLVIKFSGVNSINDALKLVGYSIYSASVSAQESQNSDVTDFIVKDVSGHVWGKVSDLDQGSLNKLLEVQDVEDVYLIPFTEEIVKEVDEKNRVIIIDPPEGLKDLNK